MPRITTRRLMALVALAACLSGLWAWGRRCSERAAHRRAEAGRHRKLAMCWAEVADFWPDWGIDDGGSYSTGYGGTIYLGVAWDWNLAPGQGPEDIMRERDEVRRACLDRSAHHDRMRGALEESALRPWAGEPAEPPRPPIPSPRLRITAE